MSRIRIASVQVAVARYYGSKLDEMLSDVRQREVAWPRQVAMYLARELTGQSYPLIGKWFHRDHSTVLHGVRQVARRAEKSQTLRKELDTLMKMLAA